MALQVELAGIWKGRFNISAKFTFGKTEQKIEFYLSILKFRITFRNCGHCKQDFAKLCKSFECFKHILGMIKDVCFGLDRPCPLGLPMPNWLPPSLYLISILDQQDTPFQAKGLHGAHRKLFLWSSCSSGTLFWVSISKIWATSDSNMSINFLIRQKFNNSLFYFQIYLSSMFELCACMLLFISLLLKL